MHRPIQVIKLEDYHEINTYIIDLITWTKQFTNEIAIYMHVIFLKTEKKI